MYTVHNHCTQRRAPGDPEVRERGASSGRSPGRGPQRLDLLSGRGAHLATAARQSSGARRRLSVVTLRMRRYTCRGRGVSTAGGVSPHHGVRASGARPGRGRPLPQEAPGTGAPPHPSPTPPNNPAPPAGQRLTSREMIRALRARLPRTRENSLTWASPAATIHLTYWLVLGSSRDRTRAARANWQSGRSRSARPGPEHRPQEAGRVRGGGGRPSTAWEDARRHPGENQGPPAKRVSCSLQNGNFVFNAT